MNPFDETEADRWDRHAAWWQAQFTDGADPEYEEQILPLAERWLAGRQRVLEVGTGEGQVARRVAAGGATVLGLDLSTRQYCSGGSMIWSSIHPESGVWMSGWFKKKANRPPGSSTRATSAMASSTRSTCSNTRQATTPSAQPSRTGRASTDPRA